ncbi:MAG: orotate phosphoribosyltransferase [Balneolales bacterium]
MIIDKDFSEELALALLKINAVVLRPKNPFVWSSGWNSPIYCDNRLTILYPDLRQKIADKLTEHFEKTAPDVDIITGTATAGIPHAAWVAERMNKPMAYVRAKAKAYGMGNQIEGGVKKGESTVIIEDLISTGSSAISVVEPLLFIGGKVNQICTIFTYGFDIALEKFKKLNIPVYSLTDYSTLIDVAQKNGYVKASDLDLLNQWRENPDKWPLKG